MNRSALHSLPTVLMLVAAWPTLAAAQTLVVQVDNAARIPAIRTDNPVLKTLIRDASERSQTFRALVAAIDATDGIVYLRVGTCGRLRACLLHQISVAGPHRVLSIIVDEPHHDPSLMGAIGHELQHALEVLGDPTITTDEGIVAFYRFHGRRIRGVLETDAAIRVGDAVRAELRRAISPRSRP
jgi:hypothetical protein